jgi:predicted enzyme related to lactoylglutathione lyase
MTHKHNAIDYIEFKVKDIIVSKEFYHAAFGWTFNDYGPEYAGIIKEGGGEVGGFCIGTPSPANGPLIIIYSINLEESLNTLKSLEAEITRDIFEFPGGRRFQFKDPSGNELAIWSET